jgi:hypothetical protein
VVATAASALEVGRGTWRLLGDRVRDGPTGFAVALLVTMVLLGIGWWRHVVDRRRRERGRRGN